MTLYGRVEWPKDQSDCGGIAVRFRIRTQGLEIRMWFPKFLLTDFSKKCLGSKDRPKERGLFGMQIAALFSMLS